MTLKEIHARQEQIYLELKSRMKVEPTIDSAVVKTSKKWGFSSQYIWKILKAFRAKESNIDR